MGGMYYAPHPPPQLIPFPGEIPVQGKLVGATEYELGYMQQSDPARPILHPQHYQEFFPSSSPMYGPPSPAPTPLASTHITASPETSTSCLQPISHAYAPPGGPQTERNQLNIARIEDGQDTRTTVMVKNIPNKMSDKDLITYIGNVCPRKVDFLYLRMDFKNGKALYLYGVDYRVGR